MDITADQGSTPHSTYRYLLLKPLSTCPCTKLAAVYVHLTGEFFGWIFSEYSRWISKIHLSSLSVPYRMEIHWTASLHNWCICTSCRDPYCSIESLLQFFTTAKKCHSRRGRFLGNHWELSLPMAWRSERDVGSQVRGLGSLNSQRLPRNCPRRERHFCAVVKKCSSEFNTE